MNAKRFGFTLVEGPRRFQVRLELVGATPLEVTYYVVGQDLVWIFRDHDYAQTSM
jgi:hypothetical protein